MQEAQRKRHRWWMEKRSYCSVTVFHWKQLRAPVCGQKLKPMALSFNQVHQFYGARSIWRPPLDYPNMHIYNPLGKCCTFKFTWNCNDAIWSRLFPSSPLNEPRISYTVQGIVLPLWGINSSREPSSSNFSSIVKHESWKQTSLLSLIVMENVHISLAEA